MLPVEANDTPEEMKSSTGGEPHRHIFKRHLDPVLFLLFLLFYLLFHFLPTLTL